MQNLRSSPALPTIYATDSGSPANESRVEMRGFFLAISGLALAALFGCVSKHEAPSTPIPITKAISAHRGACDKAARQRYGARIARLLHDRLPYVVYHCMSHTEATWLRGGCGKNDRVVFMTFARPQAVHFEQDGHVAKVYVRTLGVKWEALGKREMLLIDPQVFKIPPPPGASPYHGPELFAMFGVDGDPVGLAGGECT